ncbi:hypothetical protein LSM04_000659 [Trypanosoma melophagium]|uniref:uncharacterized protein n=1 Tax=Trypanosoma melophagium TaxID=715481 RepID=UPI00351A17A5|nr:hypothetical protein LSM04_000659 [Trypanosoma melophagium]
MSVIEGNTSFSLSSSSASAAEVFPDSDNNRTNSNAFPTLISNNQTTLPSDSINTDTSTNNDPLSIIKGILLKKGGFTSQYVRRWFELVQDVGLIYSLYGDSPRNTFQRVPLQGLSIFFLEEKRQVIIPGSEPRTKVMILKCQRREEFTRWREAIQMRDFKIYSNH